MKKLLLTISLLICVNFIFAADITLRVGDVDMTGKVAGDKVYISVYIDAITPGALITGWQFFFWHNQSYITWDGTNPNPGPGINYLSPLFPNSAAALYNVNPGSELVYLWGDGSAVADLTGQTFPYQIIEFTFTYQGGLAPGMESPIIWGTVVKLANDKTEKGETEVYDGDFDYYGLTLIDGKLFIPGVPIGKIWTGGGGDLNWFNPANWAPFGVPTSADDVTIPATKAIVTISGGVATTAALTVASGAGLVIAPTGGLTTNGLYTNNGSLVIQSDNGAGYAGTFIDNGGLAGTGTFEFDRNVICSGTVPGSPSPFGWHYLAAPFNGFTTDGLYDYFVNAWNQPAGMWMQYSMDPIAFPCTPWPTTPLGALDAWSVNFNLMYPEPACPASPAGTGVQVEFMSGVAGVHTGDIGPKALGFGAGLSKWNMVSNPYPSGLNVNSIAFGPNTVAATYYYDGCGGNYVYWATGMGNYVMAPTLGFFVETTGPDFFNVAQTSRAHGADWFWKDQVANLLTLKASGNDRSDVLHVRFADDVTAAFDNNGDAHKLFAETEGLPQIYTLAGEEMLAINALPATATVPMGFKANGSGTYTIEAIETSDFANVVLEDWVTGIKTDLLANSYSFEYNVGDNANRFMIHFTPLGTPELNANSINIWAANQTIYVQAPATTGDILVYNMMGQVVVKTGIVPGLNEIPMNSANTYYIVKVLGSEVTETGKVFIK
jgi:hypothetical protein